MSEVWNKSSEVCVELITNGRVTDDHALSTARLRVFERFPCNDVIRGRIPRDDVTRRGLPRDKVDC